MPVDSIKNSNALLVWLLVCGAIACAPGGPGTPGQENDQQRGQKKRDALLGPPDASVLLLGTFELHDAILVDKTTGAELHEIVEKLLEFKPDRLVVGLPAAEQAALDRRYAGFLNGDYEPGPGMVDRLALPVAERMGHRRIYGIDVVARYQRPTDLRAYALEHGQLDRLSNEFVSRYTRWFERESKYQATESIEDSLVWINEPRNIAHAHGRNLVGEFDLGKDGEYPGADALTGWYNRHLRMFANLQRVAGDAERILVVVDAAHVSLLRHSVESSPRFELVEVNEYLGVPQGAQRQVVPLL